MDILGKYMLGCFKIEICYKYVDFGNEKFVNDICFCGN